MRLLVLVVCLLLPILPAAADAPRLSSIAAAERDVAPGTRACFTGSQPKDTKVRVCHHGRRGPRLLLIGDSHLRALSPAFRRLAAQGKVRVTLVLRSRCGWSSRPLKDVEDWVRRDCQRWRENVARYVQRQRGVAAIVTSHRASTMPGTKAQRGPDTVRAWGPALRRHIPVIAISDSPNWVLDRPAPTQCLRRHRAPREWKRCGDRSSEVMWFDWTGPSVSLARDRYGRRAAHRIAMRDTYCPRRFCRVVTPRGQIMFRDRQHLTATYTRSLAPFFEQRLRRLGVLSQQ